MASCWLVMLSDSEHGDARVLRSFATKAGAENYTAKYNALIAKMEDSVEDGSYGYGSEAYISEQVQNEDAVAGLHLVYSVYLHDDNRSLTPYYVHQNVIDLETLPETTNPKSLYTAAVNAAIVANGLAITLHDADVTGRESDNNGRTFYSTSKGAVIAARKAYILENPYVEVVEDSEESDKNGLIPEWVKLIKEMGAEI